MESNNLFNYKECSFEMCITTADRIKLKIRYNNPNHVIQRFHERNHLFGEKRMNDMLKEANSCILDDKRCVIVPDEREDGNKSNHIAIFLTDFGSLVAIPIFIDYTHITILTLKDVMKDEKNPNWYIQKYNTIGGIRGMSAIPLFYKPF